MNREEALMIAGDKLRKLDMFHPKTESEKAILIETREFLKYVEDMLEERDERN